MEVQTALVARAREGDGRALRELLLAAAPLVQRASWRVTRDPELQRDIFQEVAARVVTTIGSFRGECEFSTWLYRITLNVAFTLAGREGRWQSRRDGREVDGLAAQGGGADAESEQADLLRHTLAALHRLPPAYQEVCGLFYFGERDVQEIAAATHRSRGAVKAILFKARRAMVKDLRVQGVLADEAVPHIR